MHPQGQLRDLLVQNAQRRSILQKRCDAGLFERLGTKSCALLRRKAVHLGENGEGVVAAAGQGEDASDQHVELSVVEQMRLLRHLRKGRDVFGDLQKQCKGLAHISERRIEVCEQLKQGRQVPFLDSLLLRVVPAPCGTERRCLGLRQQAHLDGAGTCHRGAANPLQHEILNSAVLEHGDAR